MAGLADGILSEYPPHILRHDSNLSAARDSSTTPSDIDSSAQRELLQRIGSHRLAAAVAVQGVISGSSRSWFGRRGTEKNQRDSSHESKKQEPVPHNDNEPTTKQGVSQDEAVDKDHKHRTAKAARVRSNIRARSLANPVGLAVVASAIGTANAREMVNTNQAAASKNSSTRVEKLLHPRLTDTRTSFWRDTPVPYRAWDLSFTASLVESSEVKGSRMQLSVWYSSMKGSVIFYDDSHDRDHFERDSGNEPDPPP